MPGSDLSANASESHASRRLRRPGRRWWVVVLVLLLGSGSWFLWSNVWSPSVRSTRLFEQAERSMRSGEFAEAESLASAALELQPDLGAASLLAAQAAASQNHLEQAVRHLDEIASGDPDIRITAALRKAELNRRGLLRLTQAEHAYREALELDPDNIAANEGLARLLGLCARRPEAIPHVLRLIRQGQETDLLVLISRENSVINDREMLEAAHQRVPDDPAPLIGLAWHAGSDGDHERAIELLERSLALSPDHLAAHTALGRQLLTTSRYAALEAWHAQLPSAARDLASVWLIRAELAEHGNDPHGAIRCYWEAARRRPELKTPHARLAKLLVAEDMPEAAGQFASYLEELLALKTAQDNMLLTSGHETVDPAVAVAEACQRAGRLWEAFAWSQLAVNVDPRHEAALVTFRDLQRRVADLPLQLTVDSANVALKIDLSQFPVPDQFRSQSGNHAPATHKHAELLAHFSFRDDAEAAGVVFRFLNGREGPPTRRMYELTGGGIGAFDFDRDGWPDLYFSQGRLWPPETPYDGPGDRLFRNTNGDRFVDVTERAGIGEAEFGQGVAVGDFNADGFPDVFVANIGPNRLWQNNGDGTFREVAQELGITGTEWTTSCLFADLDADGLTDLYAANYLTGEDVFEKLCQHADGSVIGCSPVHFEGEHDRLWKNRGAEGFADQTEQILASPPDGKGLGVAAWDTDGSGRLSLLVANDTTPNHFYVPQIQSTGDLLFTDRGIVSGLGVNADGQAEGCMGIAVADVDEDGLLDVHITNFLQESNTLYRALGNGFYQDRTKEFGLHDSTLDSLGFGTQFLDSDCDGQLELFVANGHIDDLRRYGRPYAMRPQFFAYESGRFRSVDGKTLGPYFTQEWLGRPVARLDWNGDGREDLAVGHLDANSALLTNTTPQQGTGLSLRFVGVDSNRDAIGTSVTVRAGERTRTRQLSAGGSYQSSSEPTLRIGLGFVDAIDELEVRWPSGLVQRFEAVPVPCDLLLVEGRDPLVLP